MINNDVRQDVKSLAESIQIGDPPTSAILAQAGKHRRIRGVIATLAVVVAASGVGVGVHALSAPAAVPVVAATPAADPTRDPTPRQPGTPTPSTTSEGPQLPDGHRWVGMNGAMIAVPNSWATNDEHCGTPQSDTVLIDVGPVRGCLASQGKNIDSVAIFAGSPGDPADGTQRVKVSVNGLTAVRTTTVCAMPYGTTPDRCVASLYLPSLDVRFEATSTTSAATVDRLLAKVWASGELAAVPGFTSLDDDNAVEDYLKTVRAAGLLSTTTTKIVPGLPAGTILEVKPIPGTMLQPLELVAVTVTGSPGVADRTLVEIGTRSGDHYAWMSHEQIRQNQPTRIKVGDEIWAYAMDDQRSQIRVVVEGSGLQETPKIRDHHWLADEPGKVTLAISIRVDGRWVDVGKVTVTISG